MRQEIENAIVEFQARWKNLNLDSLLKMGQTMEALAKKPEVQSYLENETRSLIDSLKIHQDDAHGFVLLAYFERQGTYRIPHDHGNAWVIYAVLSGTVEMGNYFKMTQPIGESRLVLKSQEHLKSGDIRIYYPGEIHDTRCHSESAVILRLTSLDLKLEEQNGRMVRYQI